MNNKENNNSINKIETIHDDMNENAQAFGLLVSDIMDDEEIDITSVSQREKYKGEVKMSKIKEQYIGGGFENLSSIEYEFRIKLDDNVNIVFAEYYEDDYSEVWVIFEQKGKIYEVHGGHCSCFGLEDQWEPELSSYKEILHRIDNDGHCAFNCEKIKELIEYHTIVKYKEKLESELDRKNVTTKLNKI